MNFIKKFIGTTQTDEIALIPSGKLFLTRSPQSPKGELECLYNDAFASIRQTTSPFYYQLCITKAYQEGELDDHGSNESDDNDDEYNEFNEHHDGTGGNDDGINNSKDEWNFPIVEDLRFFTFSKSNGIHSKSITWNDVNGDVGDKFEFIIDEDVKLNEINNFIMSLYKCLYEQKHQRSSIGISNLDQVKEFIHDPKSEFEELEELKKLENHDYKSSKTVKDKQANKLFVNEDSEEEEEEESEESEEDEEEEEEEDDVDEESSDDEENNDEFHDAKTMPSFVEANTSEISGKTIYEIESIALYLFDPVTSSFKADSSKGTIKLSIVDVGLWNYKLVIKKNEDGRIKLINTVNETLNSTFDFEHFSFIFNYIIKHDDDANAYSAYSWLVKFEAFENLEEFQKILMKSLWQFKNKKEWSTKIINADENYIIDAFSRLSMTEESSNNEEEESESESESEASEDDEEADDDKLNKIINSSVQDKSSRKKILDEEDDEYGDYENERDYKTSFRGSSNTERNSALSVGLSNDRSFVVRGNKIGVFNNKDDELNYQTTIANVKDTKGKSVNVKDLMLHQQDQFMIMTKDNKGGVQNELLKMDLNRGKIIEEWDVTNKNEGITSFGPNSKLAQLTNEQTFVGTGSNNLFKIDPRLSGDSKIVTDGTLKQYATNYNKFNSIATTQQGYLAVGSAKGDIKLYDRLGINAKTALPSLGDEIIGLDVSKDGKWILVTYKTYLTLISAVIGDGQKNSGSIGFQKYFDADKKPIPIRLTIKPEHYSFMKMETGGKFIFTKAFFDNSISDKETSIVTSMGPYLISWLIKDIINVKIRNPQDKYSIRRYEQKIIADNFKFNSNDNVIVALQDDVSILNRNKMKKASKKSLSDN